MPSASSDQQSPAKPSAFGQRAISTLFLWTILGMAMWFGYMPVVLGIATLLGIGGALEFARVFHHTDEIKSRRHPMLVFFASVTWWICVWLQPHWNVPAYLDPALLFLSVQFAFLLCYNIEIAENGTPTLRRVLSSVFGVLYTVVLYGYIARIIFLGQDPADGGMKGIPLLLFILAVTKFSDMGAYLIGSAIGSSHYMCPLISPKKTWEGFAGAFLGGFLASSLLLYFMPSHLHPLTWERSFVLVPLLVLFAVTGDLAESILKRCLHVKDAGHKLPGIGGILDLTDSLLYTAPVFYAYLMWITR